MANFLLTLLREAKILPDNIVSPIPERTINEQVMEPTRGEVVGNTLRNAFPLLQLLNKPSLAAAPMKNALGGFAQLVGTGAQTAMNVAAEPITKNPYYFDVMPDETVEAYAHTGDNPSRPIVTGGGQTANLLLSMLLPGAAAVNPASYLASGVGVTGILQSLGEGLRTAKEGNNNQILMNMLRGWTPEAKVAGPISAVAGDTPLAMGADTGLNIITSLLTQRMMNDPVLRDKVGRFAKQQYENVSEPLKKTIKKMDFPVYDKETDEVIEFSEWNRRYGRQGAIDFNAKVGGDVTEGRLGDVYKIGDKTKSGLEIINPSDDVNQVISSTYYPGETFGTTKKMMKIDDLYTNDTKFDMDIKTNERAAELAKEIKKNGKIAPIIVDGKTNVIQEGKHRWMAMNELGEKEIPVIVINRQPNVAQPPVSDMVKAGEVIRSGDKWGNKEIGKVDAKEMVARERFNIPELKKIGSGSDRDVFDLGNNQVVKITKTQRGLDQQTYTADYYAEDAGLIPNTLEEGKNYIVKEKVFPPDKNVKSMVKELQNLNTYALNNESVNAHWDEQQKAVEILNKYGFPGDDILNYGNILWGDMTRIKNWGTKNGKPILLDEGTLNGNLITGDKFKGKNLDNPEFREIYYQSKQAKKKYKDIDKVTMYGLGGLLGAKVLSDKNKEK